MDQKLKLRVYCEFDGDMMGLEDEIAKKDLSFEKLMEFVKKMFMDEKLEIPSEFKLMDGEMIRITPKKIELLLRENKNKLSLWIKPIK